MEDKIINSIVHGVNYLATKQQKDGSFLSLSSPNPKNFDKTLRFHSVFSTSLILPCLNSLKATPKINLVKRKCASFLLSQKSKVWSFNYWVRNSKEAKQMPYPDDLDDTFCALSALFGYDPKIIDGVALANVVQLLTATESQVGGPYSTWLVPKTANKVWQDIDLAVNSNIAYFLFLQEISLPKLNIFIESKIKTGNISSPYYPNIYPIIYFISRFYKRSPVKKLKDFLLSKRNKKGYWDNPLDTALAILSLINFKILYYDLLQPLKYIIKAQGNDGRWLPYPFYTGVNPKKDKTFSAGSSALTTAFCIQALGKYLEIIKLKEIKSAKPLKKELHQSNEIYNLIIKGVEKRLSTLSPELKERTLKALEITLKTDSKKQITLLPFFFKLSLGEIGKKIPDSLLIKLGMANLYGWIAYTIYDNFLDDEGDPRQLSPANISLRELTILFNNLLPNTEFANFFQQVMDQLDSANTWEVTHCRVKVSDGVLKLDNFPIPGYGDFSKLAERSLGHALTPIALLFYLGFNEKSKKVKSLFEFFKHYLIARQLNDDAHDFEKDLRMGHINAVGALLLKKYHLRTNISLSSLIPKLQEIFWYEAVIDVSNQVLKHTKIARMYLRQCSIISDRSLAEELLEKYESSAKSALEKQNNAVKFLKSYQPEKNL